MANTKLVLVRHGESQWNNENRFTGWYDVDLSEKGKHHEHHPNQPIKQPKQPTKQPNQPTKQA